MTGTVRWIVTLSLVFVFVPGLAISGPASASDNDCLNYGGDAGEIWLAAGELADESCTGVLGSAQDWYIRGANAGGTHSLYVEACSGGDVAVDLYFVPGGTLLPLVDHGAFPTHPTGAQADLLNAPMSPFNVAHLDDEGSGGCEEGAVTASGTQGRWYIQLRPQAGGGHTYQLTVR